MKRRQVILNAAASILQVAVSAGTLFLLYRFLFDTIGVDKLGIWSLVLSTTSVTRISDLGLSSSVVKFIAKYLARREMKSAAGVVQTAMISVTILVGVILLVVYPFSEWLLGLVVPNTELDAALSILPYALVSLFITVVASVVQSGLDGCQRVDLRSLIQMGASVFFLLLSLALTPLYGLEGLAYAHVIQSAVVLVTSWLLLRTNLKALPSIPYQWDKNLFREMLYYGVNFQVVSIGKMLYEPTTMALLSRFGGLAAVGYFQMARRMVSQVRSLIVTANQVVVPFIADLQERKPRAIQDVYSTSYSLLTYLAIPLFSSLIAITPLISEVWIGHHEVMFVRFSTILAVGWFLNTLTAPAYFANLGLGELRWNTVAHVVIAVLNGVLGLLAGHLYGGTAVVVAWAVSLVIGSFLIIVPYHKEHGIPLGNLLPQENRTLGLASVIGSSVAVGIYYNIHSLGLLTTSVIVTLVFVMITIVPLWLHPMRRRLMEWVYKYLLEPDVIDIC